MNRMKRLLKTDQVFLLIYRNAALTEEGGFGCFFLCENSRMCFYFTFQSILDLCPKRKVAILSLFTLFGVIKDFPFDSCLVFELHKT